MHAPSPRKTLLLLWGTAAVVLIGVSLLARQERQVRLDRDRAPLRAFAAEAQSRLWRLEDLYQDQDHLVRLGRELIPKALETGRAADEITGILQVSLLPSGASGIPRSMLGDPLFPRVPNARPAHRQAAQAHRYRPRPLVDRNSARGRATGFGGRDDPERENGNNEISETPRKSRHGENRSEHPQG